MIIIIKLCFLCLSLRLTCEHKNKNDSYDEEIDDLDDDEETYDSKETYDSEQSQEQLQDKGNSPTLVGKVTRLYTHKGFFVIFFVGVLGYIIWNMLSASNPPGPSITAHCAPVQPAAQLNQTTFLIVQKFTAVEPIIKDVFIAPTIDKEKEDFQAKNFCDPQFTTTDTSAPTLDIIELIANNLERQALKHAQKIHREYITDMTSEDPSDENLRKTKQEVCAFIESEFNRQYAKYKHIHAYILKKLSKSSYFQELEEGRGDTSTRFSITNLTCVTILYDYKKQICSWIEQDTDHTTIEEGIEKIITQAIKKHKKEMEEFRNSNSGFY